MSSPADDANALGRFLRARRDLVQPEDVGLPADGRRRVAGLRREELSTLAGVSIDYYVRLERGRDRHPSPLVLQSLARVLQLDEDATAHLHELAEVAPPPRTVTGETVRPAVARMVDAWTDYPAFVLGRRQDVLHANALAEALHPGFVAGTNLMRFVFLDRRARTRYVDWPHVADHAVASLRGAMGTALDEPALAELVDELSTASDDFRRRWERHEVRDKTTGSKAFANPRVGRLDLDFESFAVNGSAGQVLVVYSAAPGSADERNLRLLATADPDEAAVVGTERFAATDQAWAGA